MVKILLIISFLFINEERYTIKSSKIEFYSYAPLEDITAVNTESIGAIDLSTNEFLIKIPVSAFEFPNKLMQKHFNDSYLETDKYPECLFRGKILDDMAEGDITLHGQTKKLLVPITFNQSNDIIEIKTEFNIVLDDFKIKVPRLLFQNIAENINVKVESIFSKYKVQ
tara:strand:+ start:1411 stop:1914 length:504 start_codon:yes stop_codon:yes gene_type:complete